MPCWVAVRIALMIRPWVAAPRQVRLAPHTSRFTTAGRMACSLRQLVASTSGLSRKVKRASASAVRCLTSRRLAWWGWATPASSSIRSVRSRSTAQRLQTIRCELQSKESRWWDSNPRPDDYKSPALPAAPHRHWWPARRRTLRSLEAGSTSECRASSARRRQRPRRFVGRAAVLPVGAIPPRPVRWFLHPCPLPGRLAGHGQP